MTRNELVLALAEVPGYAVIEVEMPKTDEILSEPVSIIEFFCKNETENLWEICKPQEAQVVVIAG